MSYRHSQYISTQYKITNGTICWVIQVVFNEIMKKESKRGTSSAQLVYNLHMSVFFYLYKQSSAPFRTNSPADIRQHTGQTPGILWDCVWRPVLLSLCFPPPTHTHTSPCVNSSLAILRSWKLSAQLCAL